MSDRYNKLLLSNEDCDNGLRVNNHKFEYINTKLSEDDVKLVEKQVKDWLNEDNPDSVQYYFEPLFYFTKSTISIKKCSNQWDIFNIAQSSQWSNIISSDLITTIGDNRCSLERLPNEIRSETYNEKLFPNILKEYLEKRIKAEWSYGNKEGEDYTDEELDGEDADSEIEVTKKKSKKTKVIEEEETPDED